MISIEKCKEILNKKEQKYTKEQIIVIREYLYQFVEIIQIKKESNDEEGIKWKVSNSIS
jgi:hypothetical protein